MNTHPLQLNNIRELFLFRQNASSQTVTALSPLQILEAGLFHMVSGLELLEEPLTNKSCLLEEVSHFGPQRPQCSPKNASIDVSSSDSREYTRIEKLASA